MPPRNGFGYPCCADCAEHNPNGCPGHSPFCANPYASLEHGAQELLARVEVLADGVLAAVEHAIPARDRRGAEARVHEARRSAETAVELLRVVADEAHTASRPRVVEETS